jgi:hypothetical protein
MEFDDCREYDKKDGTEISNIPNTISDRTPYENNKISTYKKIQKIQKKKETDSDFDDSGDDSSGIKKNSKKKKNLKKLLESDSSDGGGMPMQMQINNINVETNINPENNPSNSSDNLISLNQIVIPEPQKITEFKTSPSPLLQLTDLMDMNQLTAPSSNNSFNNSNNSKNNYLTNNNPINNNNSNVQYINEGSFTVLQVQPGKTYIGLGNVQYSSVEFKNSSSSSKLNNVNSQIIIENVWFRTNENNLTRDMVSLLENKSTIIFRNCNFTNTNISYFGRFKFGNHVVRFVNCEFGFIVNDTHLFELYSTNLKINNCSFTITFNQNRTISEVNLFTCRTLSKNPSNVFVNMTACTFDIYAGTASLAQNRVLNLFVIENINSSISVFSNMFKLSTNKPIMVRELLDKTCNSISRFLSNTLFFQNIQHWTVSSARIECKNSKYSQVCVKDDYIPFNVAKRYESGYEFCDVYINNSHSNVKYIKLVNGNHEYQVKPTDRIIILDNLTKTNTKFALRLPEPNLLNSFIDIAGNKDIDVKIVGSNGKMTEIPLTKTHRIVPTLSDNYVIL